MHHPFVSAAPLSAALLLRFAKWLTLCIVGCIQVGALLSLQSAQAQIRMYDTVYRPPEATYRVAEGERADLIYQVGAEAEAVRMRAALRRTWTGTDALVGNTPQRIHMPIVVNRFNDRSNGFVTPLPFKQENEAVTRRTPQLVGRASSWSSLVATHELVHAVHAEVRPGFGWGGVLGWFWPDGSRALNLGAPRGLTEGIAVYRESTAEDDAGRLNAPRFQMKMRAAMLSDVPWSLTQMLERPAYTQPFNRFYIGGANAFAYWMAADSTASFFHKAASFYNRFPLLGYGVPLWYGLGDAPTTLRDSLRTRLRRTYQADLDLRAPLTQPTLIAGAVGRNHRRPYWLDDKTIVAHVSGYAVRSGFYRIDATTGARWPIRTQTIPEDRVYSLSPDTTALVTARYVPDPWAPRQWIAEVERIRLADGAVQRVSDRGRAFAPWQHADGTVGAFRSDGTVTHWAHVQPSGAVEPVARFNDTRFQQAAVHPGTDALALLVNVGGLTAVHRASRKPDGAVSVMPWFGLQDALIYDISWGPDGRYLLFGSDAGGVPNVFAFDTETEKVLQLTDVAFGAFEPAVSPDGTTLAFVNYQHERHDLARIPFRPKAAAPSPVRVLRADALSALEPASPPQTHLPESRPYQAWRYLRPRATYPVLRYDADEANLPATGTYETLGVGGGVGVAGADPLQRWAYRGALFWQDGRLWGGGSVETARWRLRPSLTAEAEPSTLPARVDGQPGRVGIAERSVALGVRAPIRLQSNVYQSSVRVALQNEVRQTRLYGDVVDARNARDPGTDLTAWNTRYTLTPSASLGYRLQQNRRDLIPNTGLAVGAVAEVDAWTNQGAGSRAMVAQAFAYAPVALRSNTGLRFDAALITQNRGSIFNLDRFVPRGYEDAVLGEGTFLRVGAEVVQPLAYVDDGMTLVPLYVKALYAYGFGQTLGRASEGLSGSLRSSTGGGVGLQARLFHALDVDLRVGLAYRIEASDVALTTR